ncbi:BMP family ABC transporter substrate-binding protein [Yinghuangia soli]|uniref:BMP family ABC transporter substrate-binding protein n=1 Tax=Yinghuangia soli TaxID=2908204 RepID=A0AA41PZB6_9ACTN|nr:BMP family ABC transporter substrate-binding protein [Yinghuangia soli]MCF2527901.1 BMP family ABC transporter substrate-binding protein [Yinghuangia soli]
MYRITSRRLAFAAVAVTAALTATACNASDKKSDSTANAGGDAAGGSGQSLVLVTPEPVGVNDFLRLAQKGTENAAKKLGGSATTLESKDPTAIQQNVESAVRKKPAVVVAVGFEFNDVIAQQAQANPSQQFLLVDSCIEKAPANVTCAVFREHEGAFLAGAEAGLLTKTGNVGAVVAIDSPQIRRFSDPFGEGAKKVKADASFTQLFVGGQNPFNDPARAKEQTTALKTKNVDVVMGAASAAGNLGVFDAAKANGQTAFGVDVNQCPKQPGTVVDNVVKHTDVAVEKAVEQIVGGKPGGVASYGLKEGGITLTGLEPGVENSQCLIAQSPDVIKQVSALRDQIVAGRLPVPAPAPPKMSPAGGPPPPGPAALPHTAPRTQQHPQ